MNATTEQRTPALTGQQRPDQHLDVPSVVAELLADTKELAHHVQVTEPYRAAVAKTVELAGKFEQARRDDAERRRDAVVAGKKAPEPRAEKVAAALAEARRDVESLAGAVRDSMKALGAKARTVTDAADAELTRKREAGEERLRAMFGGLEAVLDDLRALANEHRWVSALRLHGRIEQWRAGSGGVTVLKKTSEAVRKLPVELDTDVGELAEYREQARREAEVDSRLKAVPGQVIWSPGSPDAVVGEGGEVVEGEGER
jgi:hypothetical protein